MKIAQYTSSKLLLAGLLISSLAVDASAQASLTQRESRIRWNSLIGGGPEALQNSNDVINVALDAESQMLEQFARATSGTYLSSVHWVAMFNFRTMHRYKLVGTTSSFNQVSAVGHLVSATAIEDDGISQLLLSNPGNSLDLRFTISSALPYAGFATLSKDVANTWVGGEMALMRFDGFTWQRHFTTLFLPNSTGTVNSSGTLQPGTYRVMASIGANPFGNKQGRCDYAFNLQLGAPSTVFTEVAGQVDLEQWLPTSKVKPISVIVRNTATQAIVTSIDTTTDVNGNFSIQAPDLVSGTSYDILVKADTFLQKQIQVVKGAGSITGLLFPQTNGDVVPDNVIDLGDYLTMVAAFDSTSASPTYVPEADINGDGTVDLSDYLVLANNFDLAGDN